MKEHTVQLRNGFSDRNNIKKLDTEMQFTVFNERTRNQILNLIKKLLPMIDNNSNNLYINLSLFYEDMIAKVYGEYVSSSISYNIKSYPYKIFTEYIENTILRKDYDEILTLVEFYVNWILKYNIIKEKTIIILFNSLFEKEYVGYRFVDRQIIPITEQAEIDAINDAVSCKFDSVKEHIHNAVSCLSNRENKNYAGCLTESITAVESICKIITNEDKFDLNQALKVLESKRELKGHLKNAFTSLYNYASDNARHGKKEPTDISFSTARFALVTCSAFVNYLITEYVELEDNK